MQQDHDSRNTGGGARRADAAPPSGSEVERELRAAKQFAESIVETIHEPLLVLNADFTVKTANPAFFDDFHVTPEQTIGRRIYDLGNGQWNIPALRELLEDVLPDNRVFNDYEVAHAFEDIGRRVMLVNARRLDHVQLILLGIRDITARRRAEERLRESDQRQRIAAEAAGLGVFEWDVDADRPQWNNERMWELFGLALTEPPVNKRELLERYLHPDDAAVLDRALDEAMKPGATFHATVRIRRTGEDEWRWVEYYGRFTFDDAGRPRTLYGTLADVTERINAERALRESAERLRLAAKATGFGTYDYDPQRDVAHWSDELHAITGHPASNPVPGDHMRSIIHPDDRERFIEFVQQSMDPEGPGHHEAEYRIVCANGDVRWVRDTGETLFAGLGPHRRPVRVVGTIENVTERKQHQERMHTVMLELNHRVKNTLAVIQSMAHQTARRAPDLETFRATFDERLRSMGRAHTLLTRTEWEGAALHDIVHNELETHLHFPEQCAISGPPVSLRPKLALAMSMIIHELTTNAVKYGGLKDTDCRMSVEWSIGDTGDDQMLELTWTEQCPHEVTEPQEEGFGSRLIRQLVTYELDGELERDFRRNGFVCRIRAPFAAGVTLAG